MKLEFSFFSYKIDFILVKSIEFVANIIKRSIIYTSGKTTNKSEILYKWTNCCWEDFPFSYLWITFISFFLLFTIYLRMKNIQIKIAMAK